MNRYGLAAAVTAGLAIGGGYLVTSAQYVPPNSSGNGRIVAQLSLTGEQLYTTTGTSSDIALSSSASVFRYTGAGAATFTGFAGGTTGRTVVGRNESSSNVTLPHNVTSTAANRLSLPTLVDWTCLPGGSWTQMYVAGSTNRWLVFPGSACVAVNTSSPDGVVTGVKGQLFTNATTGVSWRNVDGSTTWWPEVIPARWGSRWFQDFIGAQNGLFGTATNTGTGTELPVAPPSTRVGIFQPSVSAVNDAVDLRPSGTTGILLGGGTYYVEMSLAITTAEDGSNRFSTRVGFGKTIAADHVDGVYFESSLALNGSTNWYRVTASNSTRTRTDTGVAPVAGTYQKLRFRVNAAATQVDYWIDDVFVGSNTTNIPTGASRDCGPHMQVIKTLGSTARIESFDYYDLAVVFSAER